MALGPPKPSEWSEYHIARHGIAMDEVAEVLAAPHFEAPGRDDSIVVLGETEIGRLLVVIVVEDGEKSFVVTARDMSSKEKKAYRRRKG